MFHLKKCNTQISTFPVVNIFVPGISCPSFDVSSEWVRESWIRDHEFMMSQISHVRWIWFLCDSDKTVKKWRLQKGGLPAAPADTALLSAQYPCVTTKSPCYSESQTLYSMGLRSWDSRGRCGPFATFVTLLLLLLWRHLVLSLGWLACSVLYIFCSLLSRAG